MKSPSKENIDTAFRERVWATTQPAIERRLDEAFRTCDQVLLVISLNGSGHFQGFCQMAGPVGPPQPLLWATPGGETYGGTIPIKWLQVCAMPFGQSLHLRNPLNENSPVKASRDGQELAPPVGRALCRLIDQYATNPVATLPQVALARVDRKRPASPRGHGGSKRDRIDPQDNGLLPTPVPPPQTPRFGGLQGAPGLGGRPAPFGGVPPAPLVPQSQQFLASAAAEQKKQLAFAQAKAAAQQALAKAAIRAAKPPQPAAQTLAAQTLSMQQLQQLQAAPNPYQLAAAQPQQQLQQLSQAAQLNFPASLSLAALLSGAAPAVAPAAPPAAAALGLPSVLQTALTGDPTTAALLALFGQSPQAALAQAPLARAVPTPSLPTAVPSVSLTPAAASQSNPQQALLDSLTQAAQQAALWQLLLAQSKNPKMMMGAELM
ncbi:putative Cleavage and polyadenylation specificity factor CPSF30 [Paratrimastix pyriformis]|uniref:Cleavage and polyadenylation specificity factor CPSF30 n=1 Tax=Paratrimastix pyriformis TaxID=342808 RepID=A0ABQ8UQ62_9EUKA|nr:putative Cleavage and polyadenylation specificity factor CPSF30 [Paratrimastix pyriformis]